MQTPEYELYAAPKAGRFLHFFSSHMPNNGAQDSSSQDCGPSPFSESGMYQ